MKKQEIGFTAVEKDDESLLDTCREMASDETRELEANVWIEGVVGDISLVDR